MLKIDSPSLIQTSLQSQSPFLSALSHLSCPSLQAGLVCTAQPIPGVVSSGLVVVVVVAIFSGQCLSLFSRSCPFSLLVVGLADVPHFFG